MQALEATAHELGMDVLVEVHNTEELREALQLKQDCSASIIATLHTFEVSLDTTYQLMQQVCDRADRLLVTESGILTPQDVCSMRRKACIAFGRRGLHEG